MVRKFLYLIAFCIVLYLGARLALQFYPGALSRLAFVPREKFVPQKPLATKVYADPKMWISRPGLADDPARWAPQGAPAQVPPVRAAVFFIHPTSLLTAAHWNASLDDGATNERARLFVRGLASPFAGATEIWAPRYRQAAFGAFLTDDPAGKRALDAAYADVVLAFDQFLASIPDDEPIVLAGHSQGSFHLIRLLHERVAGKPLAKRIAAVYAIGWPVSLERDLPGMGFPACARADQAGCVVSYLSFADPADPGMMLDAWARQPGLDGQPHKGSTVLCSNPLTGGIGGSAPASANLGTLVPDLTLANGALATGAVGASCRPDGMLSIGAGYAMGPYVLPGENYHVYDIPLFWANVRADFARRVAAWKR